MSHWGEVVDPCGKGDCHRDFYQEGSRQLLFTKEVGNILTVTIVSLRYTHVGVSFLFLNYVGVSTCLSLLQAEQTSVISVFPHCASFFQKFSLSTDFLTSPTNLCVV